MPGGTSVNTPVVKPLLAGVLLLSLTGALIGCGGGTHYHAPHPAPVYAWYPYDYFYYPGVRVYFHIHTGYYWYRQHDRWYRARTLPPHLVLLPRDRVRIRVEDDRPWAHHDEHLKRYPARLPPAEYRRPEARARDRSEREQNFKLYRGYQDHDRPAPQPRQAAPLPLEPRPAQFPRGPRAGEQADPRRQRDLPPPPRHEPEPRGREQVPVERQRRPQVDQTRQPSPATRSQSRQGPPTHDTPATSERSPARQQSTLAKPVPRATTAPDAPQVRQTPRVRSVTPARPAAPPGTHTGKGANQRPAEAPRPAPGAGDREERYEPRPERR
jgi:hypothetical protein